MAFDVVRACIAAVLVLMWGAFYIMSLVGTLPDLRGQPSLVILLAVTGGLAATGKRNALAAHDTSERPVIAATPWRVRSAYAAFIGSLATLLVHFVVVCVKVSSAAADSQQGQAMESMIGAGMLALTIHLTIKFCIGWSNITG